MAQSRYISLPQIEKIYQDDKFCLTSPCVQNTSLKCGMRQNRKKLGRLGHEINSQVNSIVF